MKLVVGSRMRERRTSGSERGSRINRGGTAEATSRLRGQPTKTRETDGGFPAGLAKNSEPTHRPTGTRDPALLALTGGEGCSHQLHAWRCERRLEAPPAA